MMKQFFKVILATAFVFCAFSMGLSAQTLLPDSSVQLAFQKTLTVFENGIGSQSRIYNGPQYSFHPNAIHGNAYYDNNSNWEEGSVNYDGIFCEHVKLLYDIYLDRVAVLLYDNYSMFSLLPERLESFSIAGKQFINIGVKEPGLGLKPGIYGVLFEKKVKLLVKQVKSLQPIANTTGVPEHYFKSSTSLFIIRDNVSYPVNSKNAALDVLQDKRKELKQYIDDNNINFRKNLQQAILMVVAEYDLLIS
jgi:hypothetical protein